MDLELTSMNIWELTTRHILAREQKHYITCELIQAEIAKRPLNERTIAKKRDAYQPIDIEQKLFRNVA